MGRRNYRGVGMATVETATEIRPFQLDIPKDALEDLRRRIEATRLPSKELVEDRSQGVQLATIRELTTYWVTDYDLGRVEARLIRRNGHPPADDRLRPAGFTGRPRRLDGRPRHRRLLQNRPRLRRRRALGQPHPGQRPGQ